MCVVFTAVWYWHTRVYLVQYNVQEFTNWECYTICTILLCIDLWATSVLHACTVCNWVGYDCKWWWYYTMIGYLYVMCSRHWRLEEKGTKSCVVSLPVASVPTIHTHIYIDVQHSVCVGGGNIHNYIYTTGSNKLCTYIRMCKLCMSDHPLKQLQCKTTIYSLTTCTCMFQEHI